MYSARHWPRRGCVGAMRARWREVAALLGLALALWVRLPCDYLLVAHFPQQSPKQLAHFLADFTNYPRLYSHIDSWSIEEEAGNFTSWRYVVAYSCGAQCAGRAAVSAHDEHATPATSVRSAPRAHRLLLHDVHCTRLPLLFWPQFCEDIEVESVITGADEADGAAAGRGQGGSRLEERTRVWCGALRLAAGRCAPRRAREEHLTVLRQAL